MYICCSCLWELYPLESEKLVPSVHSAHGVVWWLCEQVDMAPQGTWCPQGAFKSWVKLTSIYIDHIVSDMLQEKTKPSNTLPDFFGIESLLKHPACVWFAGAGPCGAINHLDWDPFKELGGQNALFWKAQGSDLSVYDFKSQRVSEDSTTVLPSQNIIFYCPHYHPVSWCIIRIPS